jgi:hypothetical protein
VVLATKMDNGKWKLKLKLKLQRRGADVGGREGERERERAMRRCPIAKINSLLLLGPRKNQTFNIRHFTLVSCQLLNQNNN